MNRRLSPWLLIFTALLIATVGPRATSVIDFSVEDLVRYSDVGIRATVTEVDGDGSSTRYALEVHDVLVGAPDARASSLELLAGIEGMPGFRAGDEIVVFLNLDNRLERIIGLRWGTYRVRGDEVLTYDGQPQELHDEVRTGRSRTFLRPSVDKGTASIPYAELKRRVREIAARMSTDPPPNR